VPGQGKEVARAILVRIAEAPPLHSAAGDHGSFTGGVAEASGPSDPQTLVFDADQALLAGKRAKQARNPRAYEDADSAPHGGGDVVNLG
jgi:PleD family two-component response regulator